MKRILALLVLPAALAGCLDTAGPSPQSQISYRVDLTAVPADFTTPQIEARGATGVLFVDGAFTAPDGCRNLQPSASNNGAVVTLTITIRPEQVPGCRTTPTVFRYEAAVGNFEPALWTLRVVHRYSDNAAAPGSGQVFEDQIEL